MTVHLRPEARADVSSVASWYEEQKTGLGSEFLDEVLRTLSMIEETPELYPRVHEDIRRALTRRFPFGVFYIAEGSDQVVLAVMHGSRDPTTWQRRT
jgi:plasmid stabilization system protein ParE